MVLFLLILCVVGVISAIAIISSLRAYTFDITQRNNAEAVMASMLRGIEKFYDSRGSVSVNVNYQTSIPGWRSTTHDGANVATISISQPWNKETLKAAVKVVSLSAEIVDITWDAGDCYVLVARQNKFNSGFYIEIKPWVDRLGRRLMLVSVERVNPALVMLIKATPHLSLPQPIQALMRATTRAVEAVYGIPEIQGQLGEGLDVTGTRLKYIRYDCPPYDINKMLHAVINYGRQYGVTIVPSKDNDYWLLYHQASPQEIVSITIDSGDHYQHVYFGFGWLAAS